MFVFARRSLPHNSSSLKVKHLIFHQNELTENELGGAGEKSVREQEGVPYGSYGEG